MNEWMNEWMNEQTNEWIKQNIKLQLCLILHFLSYTEESTYYINYSTVISKYNFTFTSNLSEKISSINYVFLCVSDLSFSPKLVYIYAISVKGES